MNERNGIKPAEIDKSSSEIVFEDLFSLEDIQQLQDEFAQATGVASIITKPDGTPITNPSNFCRLCNDIIRTTEKGQINCYKSDAAIGRPNSAGPVIKPCMSGGLWDAGAGITVEGKHIANWMIGQVRDETQSEEAMLAYAQHIGANQDDFIEAYREVPSMSQDRFKKIASMLFTLASQISSVAYQNVKQSQLITKLKRTEDELRLNEKKLLESRHRLSIVVDNLPSAMIYQVELNHDGTRHFTYVSENVLILHEVSVDSVLADANVLYSQVLPEDVPALLEAENKAAAEMRYFRHEARFILPSGAMRWFQLTSSPRRLPNGVIAWDGIERDITARKRAEEEHIHLESLLRQTQKIEAVGQLAGGVAHDLNNMLSPIIGYGELLLLDSAQTEASQRSIRGIIDAGFKARDLVQQLLAFGRKQTLDFRNIDLTVIIRNFEHLLRRTIREDIDIEFIQPPSLPYIQADERQLEQVVMNLVVNAQDAMPDGGRLSLETCTITVSENQASEAGINPGTYVRLSVHDNGSGMKPDVVEQVFEPFFSTKGMKGTGLGLATVYGIIKQHRGTITVQSAPGHGTSFEIYLPLSNTEEEHAQPPVQPVTYNSGTETVLLVEDDPQVLELTERILKQKGYNLLTANNGEEALELLRNMEAPVHLLLTDVVMPKMNGKELYQKASLIKPTLKVLYMSGYHDDVISYQGVLEQGTSFIQKPFSLYALNAKLREALGGNGT